jgi:hyperosmotically inducible periplasmic protein
MERFFALSVVTLALTVSSASAQEGILSRTGRALDNAGRGIRSAVDNGIAQGQMDAEEREILTRAMRRVEWDKFLASSLIQFEVRPSRTIVLRGSVPSIEHKKRAADLVASTVGVITVVDELAVVKDVKVIQAKPVTRIVETPAPAVVVTPPVPTESTIIVKP